MTGITAAEARHRLDKRRMRRGFERAARTYDQAAVLQREVGRRLLDRLDLIRITPTRILDAGSGTGEVTRGLADRYRRARIVALDIAESMLQRTRERFSFLRRAEVVCGDAEALPFAPDAFDLVFSNLTLQWCNDIGKTLGSLHRVLAPDGLLLFSSLGPDTLMELRESWRAVDDDTHVNTFVDMHVVGDLLLAAGFCDPVMDMEKITVTFSDLTDLMRDLKAIGAVNHTRGRSRGLTGKGRLAALKRGYDRYRDADGRLPATYEVVYGHAWVRRTSRRTARPGGEIGVRFDPRADR
jgi:malonyl-CoA O-methyltransferase